MHGSTKLPLQAVKIGLRSRTARARLLQLGRIGLRRGEAPAAAAAAVVRKSPVGAWAEAVESAAVRFRRVAASFLYTKAPNCRCKQSKSDCAVEPPAQGRSNWANSDYGTAKHRQLRRRPP
ncbi:hypothetical protein ACFPOG_08030 [Paenibacillus aestuarii]|uniref:Uncharacterized protein n=1 Tax=Paenibacillus aestuarii TaxID=516965 RepID=A0ABW0K4M8_9BACL